MYLSSRTPNASYYTTYKYQNTQGQYIKITGENDTLFSKGIYPTKVTKKDLPPWYMSALLYAYTPGFIKTKGVKYLYYKPNFFSNHMFKDDFLFISYKNPILKDEEKNSSLVFGLSGYDEFMFGWDIPRFLIEVEHYSGYDIEPIKRQIEEKRSWFQKTYPEDYKHEVGTHSIFPQEADHAGV